MKCRGTRELLEGLLRGWGRPKARAPVSGRLAAQKLAASPALSPRRFPTYEGLILGCALIANLGSKAEVDLAEILSLGPRERLLRIRRARKRFRNPLLAEALLEEADLLLTRAKRSGKTDTEAAYGLADLACEIAFVLRRREVGMALIKEISLRARRLQCEARLVAGRLEEAENLLDFCLGRLSGRTPGWLVAEVLATEADLRKAAGGRSGDPC